MAENVAATRATVDAMQGDLQEIKEDVRDIFNLIREQQACVAKKNGRVREELGRLKASSYLTLGGVGGGAAVLVEVIVWVVRALRNAQ